MNVAIDAQSTGQVCGQCQRSLPAAVQGDEPVFCLFCPHCDAHVEAAQEQAGQTIFCPNCDMSFRLPKVANRTGAVGYCAICQCDIEVGAQTYRCDSCDAIYHDECWRENQGCAVYGCSQVPRTEGLSSLEIPVSYWGREELPCPECGAMIKTTARRCRECGSLFGANGVGELDSREVGLQDLAAIPNAKRWIAVLSFLCLIPLVCVAASIALVSWYLMHKKLVRMMPAMWTAFLWLGAAVALVQTIFLALSKIVFDQIQPWGF